MAAMPEPLIVPIGGHAPPTGPAELGRAERHPDRSGSPGRRVERLVRRDPAGRGRAHRDRRGQQHPGRRHDPRRPRVPGRIGAGVTVGHNAVLHGCTVEDDSLVGMGAVVLNGATIGAGSLVAAGAVVPQGAVIPPRSMVAGVPGKVRRELSDDEVADNRTTRVLYQELVKLHRDAGNA